MDNPNSHLFYKGITLRDEMEIGSDGFGNLITYLRKNGKRFNENEKLTIIDGCSGIECPVIASITGSDAVLIVTESTKSGLVNLMRVVYLCKYFGIFTVVCTNKYDINEEITFEIEKFTKDNNIILVGKIPYDDMVMRSMNELKSINCYEESIAKISIDYMWEKIKNLVFKIYL